MTCSSGPALTSPMELLVPHLAPGGTRQRDGGYTAVGNITFLHGAGSRLLLTGASFSGISLDLGLSTLVRM